jgi:hypothetical protein
VLPELALLPDLEGLLDDPMLPDGEDGEVDDEPVAALPRLPYWSALEPVPALRLQAVIPTARTAAVSAAVTVFRFMASPLGWTTTAPSNENADSRQ